MQEFFLYREKRLCYMTTMLILLLLYLSDVHLANGKCIYRNYLYQIKCKANFMNQKGILCFIELQKNN